MPTQRLPDVCDTSKIVPRRYYVYVILAMYESMLDSALFPYICCGKHDWDHSGL